MDQFVDVAAKLAVIAIAVMLFIAMVDDNVTF